MRLWSPCLIWMLFGALLACGDDGAARGPLAGRGGDGSDSDGRAVGSPPSDAAVVGDAATLGQGVESGGAIGGAMVPGSSAEELAAFLDAMGYREAGWSAQTDAPRDPSSEVSPHGRVRVWRNEILVASQAAGNGTDLDAPKHDTGSMVVKEFYDDADALIGRATMLKLEGDLRQWAYYCGGPDARCMDSSPVHGIGFGVSCSFCHGGLVFTHQ